MPMVTVKPFLLVKSKAPTHHPDPLTARFWDASSPYRSAEFWTLTFLMPMVTVEPFLPVKSKAPPRHPDPLTAHYPCQSAECWTLTFLMPMVTVEPFLPVEYETASSPS